MDFYQRVAASLQQVIADWGYPAESRLGILARKTLGLLTLGGSERWGKLRMKFGESTLIGGLQYMRYALVWWGIFSLSLINLSFLNSP